MVMLEQAWRSVTRQVQFKWKCHFIKVIQIIKEKNIKNQLVPWDYWQFANYHGNAVSLYCVCVCLLLSSWHTPSQASLTQKVNTAMWTYQSRAEQSITQLQWGRKTAEYNSVQWATVACAHAKICNQSDDSDLPKTLEQLLQPCVLSRCLLVGWWRVPTAVAWCLVAMLWDEFCNASADNIRRCLDRNAMWHETCCRNPHARAGWSDFLPV